jgi:protein-S-isoprenylcysteine O-methyltransferase Ste14
VNPFLWPDFYLYAAFLGIGAVARPKNLVWAAGLALALAGLALWYVARRQLGSAFTPLVTARHLVTGGVYSRLRHPIYVFGSLSRLGSFVALQEPGALVVWVIVVAAEAFKARREERVLAEAFGGEYLEYKRRTWF